MKQYLGKYLTINSIKDVMYDIALQEIDGMDEEEAKDFSMNDAIPSFGSVSNLVWFSQTEPIACEYYDEIMELANDFYYKNIPYEIVKSLNNITWFAWEYIILGNKENVNEIIKIAKEKGIINE